MADPKLEEFSRARELQQHFFRDVQRHVRDVIQPQLEEREQLLIENAELKSQIAALTTTETATARSRKAAMSA